MVSAAPREGTAAHLRSVLLDATVAAPREAMVVSAEPGAFDGGLGLAISIVVAGYQLEVDLKSATHIAAGYDMTAVVSLKGMGHGHGVGFNI